ncbi:MAG TPA: UDP-3-O-(3-hydroxymyristoyl)glucosamine N-acyltransferase [Flavobacteriaceae bacterium]|jgi:UDP-3-O-[3-hydroxymyristoyl] glucosamine N-acyltransferase|nr:UDP-3-O-(3-hydroxymyristoyl)glucosamine N-acyltransferase [Flavobacteriaceae bacterium]HBS11193.1 UDP-3-O-(3-hydroxymyristoyl)glucosamine N-acyltransferase [Flavobacteriaceae bacterium]
MKFYKTHTLKEISKLIDSEFIGNDNFVIYGMNEIHVVEHGDIVFVDHPKYYDKALQSAASVVLINKKVACPEGKVLLISDDPFRDFCKLATHFKPFQAADKPISDSATIGKDTIIQPNVFIGNHVTIGDNCTIHPNVVIYDGCTIGNNVIIHAGTILGADAFYYKNRPEGLDRLISCGTIRIDDNVEIGANCTIDRGVTGITTIKEGTKIDNLVQIAHDTIIGRKCLIAAHVAIAGCSVLEDEVTIWGQVGISSGITIGTKAVVNAQSGVGRDLEGGRSYFGSPCDEARKKYREMAAVKVLPQIIAKVNNI